MKMGERTVSIKQIGAILTAIGLALGSGVVAGNKLKSDDGINAVELILSNHNEQTDILREVARDLAVLRSIAERGR